jgi:hypothetical protein
MNIYSERNRPIDVKIRDGYIWITVTDGHIVGVPLHWYDWLQNATSEQQANYRLGSFSIVWDDLEDGIDIKMLLIDMP